MNGEVTASQPFSFSGSITSSLTASIGNNASGDGSISYEATDETITFTRTDQPAAPGEMVEVAINLEYFFTATGSAPQPYPDGMGSGDIGFAYNVAMGGNSWSATGIEFIENFNNTARIDTGWVTLRSGWVSYPLNVPNQSFYVAATSTFNNNLDTRTTSGYQSMTASATMRWRLATQPFSFRGSGTYTADSSGLFIHDNNWPIPPTGGCCVSDRECRITTQQQCTDDYAGAYLGDDTDCGVCDPTCTVCLPYVGACCLDEVCEGPETELACTRHGQQAGATHIAWSNADDDCAGGCLGACFTPEGICFDWNRSECDAGARFAGEFGSCVEYGPCYIDGQPCLERTKPECDNLDGLWGGPNKTCAQSGACVNADGKCVERTASLCSEDGNSFWDDQTCANIGPCLYANGACEMDTATHCRSGHGVWGGPNCACGDNTCICRNDDGSSPQCPEGPDGACRAWGDPSVCQIQSRRNCRQIDGLFCGGDSTCDGPCDGEYACCWRDLGIVFCEVLDAADCGAVGGSGGTINPYVTSCDGGDACLFGAEPCNDYALWTGGGGTDTSILNPNNWDSGEAPTSTTPVKFETGVVVTIPQNTSVANTLVAQGLLSFSLGGHTLRISTNSALCDDLIVGAASSLNAAIDLAGGTVAGPEKISVGAVSDSVGMITVGSGGVIVMKNDTGVSKVSLGATGGSTGLLTIEGGGQWNATDTNGCTVGDANGANGALVVRNPGSFMNAGAALVIGNGGTGTLEISDSARVDVGVLTSGNMPGSVGDITISSNATLNFTQGTVAIGKYGTSTMTVNSGNITNTNLSTEPHTIGEQPGSIGTVILQGGTTWDARGDRMAIAESGTGEMRLSGRSDFSCDFLKIGGSGDGLLEITEGSGVQCQRFLGAAIEPGSKADIIIDGAQSKLEMVQNFGATVNVGGQGTGHLLVTNGGQLEWKGGAAFGREAGSEGTLTVNGGTALFGADLQLGGLSGDSLIDAGHATATVANGGIMIVAGALHIRAMNTLGVPDNVLTVDGQFGLPGVLTTEELRIGRSGIALVSNGGQLTTRFLAVLGGGDGSFANPARVVVDGTGSLWNVERARLGDLRFGIPGEVAARKSGRIIAVLIDVGPEGTLTVDAGGRVDAATLLVNGGTITNSTGIFVGGVPQPLRAGVTEGIFTQQLNVQPGATLDVPSIALMPNGTIAGGGNIAFDMVNEGEISPGGDDVVLATLTVTGTYQQTATGVLRIDLGADGASDALVVTGTASLGGTLIVERGQCATVLAGQPHVVFTAAGVPGEFDQVIAPDHTNVNVEYVGGQVIVSLTETVYLGDSDGNGGIDLNDYADFSACSNGPDGGLGVGCECIDLDGDRDNDLRDFAVFQTLLGS